MQGCRTVPAAGSWDAPTGACSGHVDETGDEAADALDRHVADRPHPSRIAHALDRAPAEGWPSGRDHQSWSEDRAANPRSRRRRMGGRAGPHLVARRSEDQAPARPGQATALPAVVDRAGGAVQGATGVSFEDRQDLLGHRSGRITTHYSAAELSRLVEAAERACENKSGQPELVVLRGVLQTSPAKENSKNRSWGLTP